MTVEMTTEQKKVKELFEDRVKKLSSIEHLYRSTLLLVRSNKKLTLEETIAEQPELAMAYRMSQRLVEAFQIMDVITENMFSVNAKIAQIDIALEDLSKKTNTDISNVKVAVGDLEKTILPNLKALVQLFDNLKKAEDQRKKNGEDMIV